MNNITKITTGLAAIAGLALATSSAHAQVSFEPGFGSTFTAFSDTADQQYTANVSTDDLLDGLTFGAGTVIYTPADWTISNGAHPDELNDGVYGATSVVDAGGAWTNENATIEYDLGLGVNDEGYDITSIQSIASWNGAGFGNQAWTVEVKAKGAVNYDLLATVNYIEFGAGDGGSTIVDLAPLNATGIEFIKFTAGATGIGDVNSIGNDFVWREIDVFGTATAIPEPSTSALLGGLLALGAVMTRRRSA